ncbi:MAG: hypothetical protein ACI9C1_000784 [Candidatus Aldehydirespiratoraceae bacterium]|jgi:hypothetical protein
MSQTEETIQRLADAAIADLEQMTPVPPITASAPERRAGTRRPIVLVAVALAVAFVGWLCVVLLVDEGQTTETVASEGRDAPPESTVESDLAGEAVDAESDAADATVVSVDPPPPPPGATEPVGRCYEFSGPAADSARVGCIFGPGIHLWEWNSEIYLLKRGAAIRRTDQEPIDPDPETGLAIAKYADNIDEHLFSCVERALVEAVTDISGPDAPPMFVTACSGDNYAFVNVDHVNYLDRQRTVVMGSSSNGNWEFVAEIDFGNPDRVERCASLPDDPPGAPQSVRALCTMLG